MEFNKEFLNKIARPLSKDERESMEARRKDRYWKAASSAIAAKVRRQLKVTGTSRVMLAEKLGVTPANITRYLNGTTNFELKTLVELERVLDIHIIDRTVVPKQENKIITLEVNYTINSSKVNENVLKTILDYA